MSNGSFEYTNESSIDENYRCPICKDPLESPVTTLCDHTYCQRCIDNWFTEDGSTCPTCRQLLSVSDVKPVTTRLILNILDRLLVKCSQCEQTGIQRGNFGDHLSKLCPKRSVACTAFDLHCPWEGLQEQRNEHLAHCHYESLRSVLMNLNQKNQELQEEVQTLNDQVKILQCAGEFPAMREGENVIFCVVTVSSAKYNQTFDHVRSTRSCR